MDPLTLSGTDQHIPVLLDEAIQALVTVKEGIYIDCTFGRGGHSRALLACLGPQARVLALDQDPSARSDAEELARHDARFEFERTTFELLGDIVKTREIYGRVNGVFFDLGISTPQLGRPERGFSFQSEGPLDMRMNPQVGEPASNLVNSATEAELVRVLKVFGEERHARRIARAIIGARKGKPLETTTELAALISACVPRRERGPRHRQRIHPATKTFQALRIAVNRELDALTGALREIPEILAPWGRLVVISFHSLEDRIVKRFIRELAKKPNHPFISSGPRFCAIGRHRQPKEEEINDNPRARSAVMRVAERLA